MTNHPELPDFDRLKNINSEPRVSPDPDWEDDVLVLRDELASANLGLEILESVTRDVARLLDETAASLQNLAERLRQGE